MRHLAKPVRQLRVGNDRFKVGEDTSELLRRFRIEYDKPVKTILDTVLFDQDTRALLDRAFRKKK